MARVIPSEHGEQVALIQWARLNVAHYPELKLLFAVPNQGAGRNKRLQLEGCSPGVPDICLPVPRPGYHGLWLELKRIGGKVSREQNRWIVELRKQGYCAYCVVGFEAARDLIERYLRLTTEE